MIAFILGFVLGAFGGAFVYKRYAAKAAADLATIKAVEAVM